MLWQRDLSIKGLSEFEGGSAVATADRAARKWQAEVDAQGKLLHEEVGDPLPPPGRAAAK